MLTKFAWKNIWHKPLNTTLSLILLVTSIAMMTVLVLIQEQFENQFNKNIDDIDLVLGAQGSPLQLILSAVYHVDNPTGNISYKEAKTYIKHPHVSKAIPLAFGDNYFGFKIIGTNEFYHQKYDAKISEGRFFDKDFEAVIGYQVAQKAGLKIGDKFYGTHGDSEDGEVHDDQHYTVVGILDESKYVIDNTILCTLSSVWNIHAEYEETSELDEDEQEITAVLLSLKNQMAKITWPRIVPQNTKMQAASPGIEINRLFSLFGIGISTLEYLSYTLLILSGLSIFIALYNKLKERQYEFALMRISGASAFQLFTSILLESLFLVIVGIVFGAVLGRLAVMLISSNTEEQFNLIFSPYTIIWQKEGWLWLITFFVGIFAALIPAIKAFGIQISKTLNNA